MKFDMALWKRIRIPLGVVGLFVLLALLTGVSFTSNPSALTYNPPIGFSNFVQEIFIAGAMSVTIAFVVSEVVETAHRQRLKAFEAETNERLAQAQQETLEISSRAAARAVFGEIYANELIEESQRAIFSSLVFRDSFHCTYRFCKHPKSDRLIELFVTTEYEVRARAPSGASFSAVINLPNVMAKFPLDPCREKPRLISARVGKHLLTDEELQDRNDKISIDDDRPHVVLSDVSLPYDQTVKVRVEHKLIKLRHDNEAMRVLIPTNNVTVEVSNEVGSEFNIAISSIHREEFGTPDFLNSAQTHWRWPPPGVLLPQNGWVLFWNDTSQNPSGSPSQAELPLEPRESSA